MGPFEEEEEGTGVASDVVKVQGEDPATPGPLPLRNDPGTVTIPQYRFNKNKATHTHTPLFKIWRPCGDRDDFRPSVLISFGLGRTYPRKVFLEKNAPSSG